MRSSYFGGLAAGLVFVACSTTSVQQSRVLERMPPPLESRADLFLESPREKIFKSLSDREKRNYDWFTNYKKAQSSTKTEACTIFLNLAQANEFPIQELAWLRAFETCGGANAVPAAMLLSKADRPWLRPVLYRAMLAQKHVLNAELHVRALEGLADNEPSARGKEDYLQNALKIVRNPTDRARLQRKLWAFSPRLRSVYSEKDFLSMANDFKRNRHFDKAREFYRKVWKGSEFASENKLDALNGIRFTYKLQKNSDQFLKWTQTYAKFAQTQWRRHRKQARWLQLYHDTHTAWARAVWTEGQVSNAQEILRNLQKDIAGRFSEDEVIWLLARIEEESGNHTQVLQLLDKASTEKNPNLDIQQKVRWYKAWNLRKVNRLEDSIALLKRMNEVEKSPAYVARNRFWLGKNLQGLKKESEAKEEFNWLKENDPMGYYGLLAYQELQEKMPPLGMQRGPASVPPNSLLSPEVTLSLEWMLAVDENTIAKLFLEGLAADFRRHHETNTDVWQKTLGYYAKAGHYHGLFAQLQFLPASLRSELLQKEPELFFPRPFLNEINASAEKFSVDPALVYAIIRQESSFNPYARSPADAFGLMQLIPEVARATAQHAGVPFEHPEDLYDPKTNVTLGSAYLRELLARFRSQFVITVASYNASEKAIQGWLKTRYKGDALEFIEDIPYEETRTYIKLVLRNLIYYQRLNSPGSELAFPSHCLENLQDASI